MATWIAVETVAGAVAGGPEVLEAAAPEWRDLCDEGWNPHPFCRPEWLCGYARAFEPGKEFVLVTSRTGETVRGLLPLVRERASFCGVPVRKLRGAGFRGTRFDVVRSPGAEGDEAVSAIWGTLRGTPDWDVIELPDVPEQAAIRQLVDEAAGDGFPTGYRPAFWTPVVPLTRFDTGRPDPWLTENSKNFRGLVRKKTRRLQEQGELRMERFDAADPAALSQYYELEQGTWKGRQGCAIGSTPQSLRFYDELAGRAAELGHLTLYLLKLGDRAVAGQFGFTYLRRYFFLRCAFSEEFAAYSPAHILINWVLRDCVARGVVEFDFVGEAHEWKRPWTFEAREHGFYYVFRRGMLGTGLRAVKFGAVPLARKLLRTPFPRKPVLSNEAQHIDNHSDV